MEQRLGLVPFLLGDIWESTAAQPTYGILPFILTSIYGTAGAILFGVPVGFFAAVYLAKLAGDQLRRVRRDGEVEELLSRFRKGGVRFGDQDKGEGRQLCHSAALCPGHQNGHLPFGTGSKVLRLEGMPARRLTPASTMDFTWAGASFAR